MTPDGELLRSYARTKSEEAFAELVRRHIDLVYSAVLRRLNGDAHLAQDAAQSVFTDLARKASSLSGRATLTGWLYTSAHFAAADIARAETRRRRREEQFMREPVSNAAAAAAPDPDWEKLRPVLDDVMHQLKETDREAILLRYFENRPLAEVGMKLSLGENAARMRVERALQKMRALLAKRGIATTEALAAAISANAVQIAPTGMAASMAAASLTAMAGAAAAGTGTLTLLKIMTATQIKLGFTFAVVAGMATALVVQQQTKNTLNAENASLTRQVSELKANYESLSNQLAAAPQSASLPDSQLRELMRLRGEVGMLREEKRRQKAQQPAAPKISAAAPEENLSPEEQQKQIATAKMNDLRQLALAQIMYADNNKGQLATNFDQLHSYMAETGLNKDSQTGADKYEMVYTGPYNALSNHSTVLLMREPQSWQTADGQWARSYVFADGHAEVRVLPTDNFDDYEQQHTVQPTPPQDQPPPQ
jgi:RNA polymerase sigma factor (sigma-70 family)